MGSVFKGFKDFITRSNAVDLAVGVVIGAAFKSVVDAVVEFLVNPLVAALFGKPDISNLWFITVRRTASGAPINISLGGIANTVLNLIIVGAALYFFIVLPMNKLAEFRAKLAEPEEQKVADDVAVLQEIRDLLAAQNAEPGSAQPVGTKPGNTEPTRTGS